MTSTSALSGEYFPPIPPIPMARLQPDGTLVPVTTAHAQGEMAIGMPALMPASTIETSAAAANYNAAADADTNNDINNMQQQQILSLVAQMNAALDANTSQIARMQAEINELKDKCNVLESRCGHLEGINKHKQPIINHQKVNNNTAPQKQKEQASQAQAQALKPKRKRTNHSKGDSMRQAVEEWDSLQNNQQGEEQPLPTLAQHAAKYGLKKKTLEKYVYKDLTKRRKLGSQSGRKSIVSAETAELLIQHYTNNNNNNSQGTDCGSGSVNIQGRTATEVRQNLEMLQPDLRPMQARNYIQRTFKKKAAEGRVVATRQTANTSLEVSVPELPEPHWGGLGPGENDNEHDEC